MLLCFVILHAIKLQYWNFFFSSRFFNTNTIPIIPYMDEIHHLNIDDKKYPHYYPKVEKYWVTLRPGKLCHKDGDFDSSLAQ